jgi:hypothetical protein
LDAQGEEVLRQNIIANFGFLNGYTLIEPTDSYSLIRLLFDTSKRIESLSECGDLDTLRLVFEEICKSKDPLMNKQNTWHFFENNPNHFGKALKNDHWDVIKFLTEVPFAIPPTFGHAVAELALCERSTEKLQRILDLGWNINDRGKESLYSNKTPTVLW